MKRIDAVQIIAEQLQEDWLAIACNGMIGRELYTVRERASNFYMIGSMGLASMIGLGLARTQPGRRVVIFDGDGNVLMNMGTLGNVAEAAPSNLYHVVFDNGVHGSTGGQRTISGGVPIDEVARACGYRRAIRATTEAELRNALVDFWSEPGPAMLLVKMDPGENRHDIARVEIPPPELAQRFRTAATARA